MESIALLFGIVIALAIYIGVIAWISDALRMKNGRKAFWWVFFFGIVGAAIALLIDIRDGQEIKKEPLE